MRILITADTIGGVWTYTRELVTTLSKLGHSIILVSFGNIPTPEQTAWMDGLSGIDFHPTAFRLEWMQESESDLDESAAFLSHLIAETKPDLLHLNQFCYGTLKCDVPKLVVAHSDVISWWRSVHNNDPKPDWISHYRDVVSAGIHSADALVGVSRWMLEQVHDIYGKPGSSISSVIYNGRTPTLFNPHLAKEESALTVGRLWDSGKQPTLLLDREPPMPVCIAGIEQQPETGGSIANDCRLTRVTFKGPQNEAQLRMLFARASIYVIPSRYEPFGLAPLEAALSRCALVANDIPSLREIWGDAALYFSTNNSAAMLSALERLQQEPELHATYAGLAYTRAQERYTAKRMTDDYLHLYSVLTQRCFSGSGSSTPGAAVA